MKGLLFKEEKNISNREHLPINLFISFTLHKVPRKKSVEPKRKTIGVQTEPVKIVDPIEEIIKISDNE